ncbi:MAG TPA: transglycosylase domain-containing protein [Candidatus Methylacidiphilales bacterium]
MGPLLKKFRHHFLLADERLRRFVQGLKLRLLDLENSSRHLLRRYPAFVRERWFLAGLGIALAAGAWTGMFLAYYLAWAVAFDLNRVKEMPLTTTIYDRNGAVLRQVYEENRQWVPSEAIPDVLRKAVVATEDRRFYLHPGVDVVSIVRAAARNVLHGRISSGASTITQQLARNSAEMSERTMGRKLKEIALALRIERAYSKDEILTLYLNRIFWGRDCYGIGSAADAYFGKKPADLTLPEAAMLAGIISGPNTFSPWRSPAKAHQAMERSLGRMVERGYITEKQRQEALAEPLALRPLRQVPASYAAAEAVSEATRLLGEEIVRKGGLKIETSVDSAFQQTAEAEIERQLAEVEAQPGYGHTTRAEFLQSLGEREASGIPYLEGTFVAIGNRDGGILALVGGRNFSESRFDRALYSRRQVGSTAKPFVYANAFNTLNASAATLVDWSPYDLRTATVGKTPLQGPQPDFVTFRQALATSNNYASVRIVLASGVDSYAHLFGKATGTAIPPYPSSALGACEVTPLRMTSAFSLFPNGGVRIEPWLVKRITGPKGEVLYEHKDKRETVLSSGIAFQLTSMMQAVVDEGTGNGLRLMGLKGDIAGKTGTTNDYRDAWFIGFTSEVTAGVWVGFDKPSRITGDGYGSRIALPIWGRIMAEADQHYLPQPFAPPAGLFREGVLSFFGGGDGAWLRDDQRDGYLQKIGDDTITAAGTANGSGPASQQGQEDNGGVFGWMSRIFGGGGGGQRSKVEPLQAPSLLDGTRNDVPDVPPSGGNSTAGGTTTTPAPRAIPVTPIPVPPEENQPQP